MELGPIQKAWVKSLKEHPERQTSNLLGIKLKDGYKACCLGELHIIGCEMLGRPSPFDGDVIKDKSRNGQTYSITNGKSESEASLLFSYNDYGLKSPVGGLEDYKYSIMLENIDYSSLTVMNDNNVSWPKIAEFIEKNPEAVFIKSV